MAKLLFLQSIECKLFGPMYISAMVRGSHECRLSIGRSLHDFEPILDSFKPDVVGFSVATGSHPWALRIARGIKARYNVVTLLGGPHPTYFPECIEEPGVDIICRGEGEEATLELLNAIDAGTDIRGIQNLHIKQDQTIYRNDVRPLRDDLDFFPFPDRDLYDSLGARFNRSAPKILTSRGCMYNCGFCCQGTLRELYRGKGRFVRTRSIGNVIKELVELKNNPLTKTIAFDDDIFGYNRKWLYELLDIYKKEIGLDFICLIRADMLSADKQDARRLRDAGCTSVSFGIETGSEKLRNHVLGKNLADKDIYAAARNLHDAGIPFRTFNIFGLPGETLEDSWETVRMNIAIKTDYPWASVFMPYPRTPLAHYAHEHGYLPDTFSPNELPKSFWASSCIKAPGIRQMVNLQLFFQTAILCPWMVPLIRLAVKLPTNPVYKLWFGIIYVYVNIKSESQSLLTTLMIALRNIRVFW